ncbi:hypothetical protein GPECTOR_1g677 [Gonium pectorale]|uniref:Uncharacterized protein n=1 Tax=Gonium pectorale TaxID=33097 RepID=A0A150H3V7_GONPE|nr:hypothetical protein GPECTOR_1g677 [Gonium pectorale]|eukprot:KXZ56751.1 hypothetical protein GPECTOR_1g677 [Gonium pectorale]
MGKGNSDSHEDADEALKKLEEYGERFMSMFDDADKKKASTTGRNARAPVAGGRSANGAGAEGASGDRALQVALKKAPKDKVEQQRLPPALVEKSPRAAADDGAKGKRKAGRDNEIDVIMRMGKKAKRQEDDSSAVKGKGGKGTASQAAQAAAAQQAAMAEALKRERRLFMSHKASKVHEAVSVDTAPRSNTAADDAGLSPADFQKLQMEVEKFAVVALDKKSAKQAKARMLARVGAKADTAPRTALSIGKGMAKMASKRQARALEEAIETGMVQRKGLGKKKRALQAKNRDRGLMEAGPSFRNGVLRVKPLKKQRAESGKLRLPKGML